MEHNNQIKKNNVRNVKKTDEKGKRKPVVKWMLVWKKKSEKAGIT